MNLIRLVDFTPAYKATDKNAEMLYARCIADGELYPESIYAAGCLDMNTFDEQWDFSSSFHKAIEVAPIFTGYGKGNVHFRLVTPEPKKKFGDLDSFPFSDHSPLAEHLHLKRVPKRFGGSKYVLSDYGAVARALQKKDMELVFDGFAKFELEKGSERRGLLSVFIYMPRYDYVADWLEKYF